MHLLIVNPNTSAGVTERIAAAARAAQRPGDRFEARSAAFGPELIVSPEDAEEATRGVIAAIEAYSEHPHGLVLASFGDTGATEVRARWPHLPVLGIAEAAFVAANRLDRPFAIVTFAPEMAPALEAKAHEHGAGPRLMRVAHLHDPLSIGPAEIADKLFDPLADLCTACARDGAEAIVLGGGPLAGLAGRIAPLCDVPIIDGTTEAIDQMRGLTAQSQAI